MEYADRERLLTTKRYLRPSKKIVKEPFRFLDLPREIQIMIAKEALTFHSPIIVARLPTEHYVDGCVITYESDNFNLFIAMGLIKSCRTVHQYAISLFYMENQFCFVGKNAWKFLERFLSNIGAINAAYLQYLLVQGVDGYFDPVPQEYRATARHWCPLSSHRSLLNRCTESFATLLPRLKLLDLLLPYSAELDKLRFNEPVQASDYFCEACKVGSYWLQNLKTSCPSLKIRGIAFNTMVSTLESREEYIEYNHKRWNFVNISGATFYKGLGIRIAVHGDLDTDDFVDATDFVDMQDRVPAALFESRNWDVDDGYRISDIESPEGSEVEENDQS